MHACLDSRWVDWSKCNEYLLRNYIISTLCTWIFVIKSVVVEWSVESQPFNPAARIQLPAGPKILNYLSDKEPLECEVATLIYTGWKGNKCHPFNSRRGRLKGPKNLYKIWGLNLRVSSEKGVSCSVLFTSYCLYR